MSSGRRLEGKCCVITGAASGIGQGIATLFSEHGGRMVLMDIADCSETMSKMSIAAREDAMYIKCDISSESQVIAAAKSIHQRYSVVDCMLHMLLSIFM